LDIDSLAIPRPKPAAMAQAEMVKAIQLASSHVGKLPSSAITRPIRSVANTKGLVGT
jgi:hypothetical protein